MLFVFLVTFFGEQFDTTHVMDYEITGAECIALIESYKGEGFPSCELDYEYYDINGGL